MTLSRNICESVETLFNQYQKGTITGEEAIVKVAYLFGIEATSVTGEQIKALGELVYQHHLMVSLVGEEHLNSLQLLHSRLTLAQENKLILSGRKRVIQIERNKEDDWKGVYPGMCIDPEICRGKSHCPRTLSCCE
jgi:hypothetical protein